MARIRGIIENRARVFITTPSLLAKINYKRGVINMTKKIVAKICLADECDRRSFAKGMCSMHYYRVQRTGVITARQKNGGIGTTADQRFWSRVALTADDSHCWEWQGGLEPDGYARVMVNRVKYPAHRYAWLLVKGTEPSQLLLHSCDNRRCVNPNHLREGTTKDNAQDRKERNPWGKGDLHPGAKLTTADVLRIRDLCETTMRLRDIANQFGVQQCTIQDIKYRRSWAHL